MSASVISMSMSLDGYIAGPNDSPHNPGGDNFMRLHEWYGFGPGGPKGDRREVRASSFWTKSRRPARSSRVGALWSRSITGAVTITRASGSSCPVTVRRHRPSRSIRW